MDINIAFHLPIALIVALYAVISLIVLGYNTDAWRGEPNYVRWLVAILWPLMIILFIFEFGVALSKGYSR